MKKGFRFFAAGLGVFLLLQGASINPLFGFGSSSKDGKGIVGALAGNATQGAISAATNAITDFFAKNQENIIHAGGGIFLGIAVLVALPKFVEAFLKPNAPSPAYLTIFRHRISQAVVPEIPLQQCSPKKIVEEAVSRAEKNELKIAELVCETEMAEGVFVRKACDAMGRPIAMLDGAFLDYLLSDVSKIKKLNIIFKWILKREMLLWISNSNQNSLLNQKFAEWKGRYYPEVTAVIATITKNVAVPYEKITENEISFPLSEESAFLHRENALQATDAS